MFREIRFKLISRISETEFSIEGVKSVSFNYEAGAYQMTATKFNDELSVIDWENHYLCQSTAMFDKNGTNIYHGDIIKDQEGKHFEVMYGWGAFFIVESEDGDRIFLTDNLVRNMEVAGNIFNNPELVTKQLSQEELTEKFNATTSAE